MAYTLIKSLPAIDREQEFRGLSTDTKPTTAENGVPILNGAVFYCMDTKAVFMYDSENTTWIEQ